MAIRSLGKVTVTSAGTPVRATVGQTTPSARVACQTIKIYATLGNSGANIYVGTASDFSKSTFANMVLAIPKGTTQEITIQQAPAGLNAADLWIDADTTNDTCLVTIVEQ